MPDTDKPRQNFRSIQILRAAAALMVVFHHAKGPQAWLFNPLHDFEIGQAGVDLFFVISGFVMYSSARHQPAGRFLARRIIRIVPLYWLGTISVAALLLVRAGLHEDWILINTLKSMVFLPHYNAEQPTEIWPVLIPGWTLNVEMFFYGIFALGLVARRPIPVLTAALGLLVLGGVLHQSQNALWRTYTSPLLLEFLGGALLARFAPKMNGAKWVWLLPLGAVALGLSTLTHLPRLIAWGMPALAMVAGALALERLGRLPRLALFATLGDASYSIYVFHPFALVVVARLVSHLPLAGYAQLSFLITLSMTAAAVAGLVIYFLVERPLIRLLKSRAHRPVERADVLAAP